MDAHGENVVHGVHSANKKWCAWRALYVQNDLNFYIYSMLSFPLRDYSFKNAPHIIV